MFKETRYLPELPTERDVAQSRFNMDFSEPLDPDKNSLSTR